MHVLLKEKYMKKAFRFSILSLALALCGGSVALIHAKNNSVKETKAYGTTYATDSESESYTSVEAFVSALETTNNRIFTIKTDFSISDTIDLSGKTLTIDLAMHTLSGTATTLFNLSNNTDLTILSNSPTNRKGKIDGESQKIFNLTGATLHLDNVNIAPDYATSGYLPIWAASGTNIIRTNNVTITNGYTGVVLSGNSSLYTAGTTIFTNQGDGYSINCSTTTSHIYLSGAIVADRPINTTSTISFFNGNLETPTYLQGISHTLTINVSSDLRHDGDIIIRGVQDQGLLNSVTISGLENTGYDSSVVDSAAVAGAKDVKTVYYSCAPQITGSKFTIISQTNPAIYSTASSYNAEYILEADLGYYFGTQRSDYLTISIGGGDPLTSSQYSYGPTVQYYGAQYYKRCTINIPRNLIKGQLVIAVTPGVSNYLQTVRTFISSNMHMNDYDSELTGVGDNSCKTYYGTAKTEFQKLGNPEREVFMLSTDQDVINARERFLAWADANGDKVVNQDGTYVIARKSNILNPIQENNNDIYPVIIISSAIAISSIAVTVLYAKKRKESSR